MAISFFFMWGRLQNTTKAVMWSTYWRRTTGVWMGESFELLVVAQTTNGHIKSGCIGRVRHKSTICKACKDVFQWPCTCVCVSDSTVINYLFVLLACVGVTGNGLARSQPASTREEHHWSGENMGMSKVHFDQSADTAKLEFVCEFGNRQLARRRLA